MEKFYSHEPSPQDTPLENPTNEELVDLEKEDDYFVNELAEDDQFLVDENLSQMEID